MKIALEQKNFSGNHLFDSVDMKENLISIKFEHKIQVAKNE